MKDAPKTIYLQVCEENECDSEFSEHEGVTWCEDKINDSDIQYARSDISQQRTWVGLTTEDIYACDQKSNLPQHDITNADLQAFAYEIEAKLKEKNNG